MESTTNVITAGLTVQQVRDRLQYGDITRIARRTGRAQGHVSQVVAGTRPDRKVAVAIARMWRLRLADMPAEMYERRTTAAA
jgi:hypothetical protein